MKDMKISHITNAHGDTFEITGEDQSISLSPAEAVLVLQFLYERVDELTRLVNGLEASEPIEPVREPLLQECPYCGAYHIVGTIEQCPMKRLT